MKHKYIIKIGELNGEPSRDEYTYRNTKVEIKVYEQGLQIKAEMGVEYDKEKLLTNSLFSDALRKALLLYYISQSKGLSVKKAAIQINGKDQKLKEEELSNLTISIIPEGIKLTKPFPEEFRNKETTQGILKQVKSGYDALTAA